LSTSGAGPAVDEATDADVEIRYGVVPADLEDATGGGARFQAASGRLLLHVDGIARFLVEDGRRITVERADTASDDDVRPFLVGSAFGALFHQRGLVCLHGSSVDLDGRAVCFLGFSGAGKSTLAAACGRRGLPVLADDLCVIHWRSDEPVVTRGLPEMKMWRDSLTTLGLAADGLLPVRRGVKKLRFSAMPWGAHGGVPLAALCVLGTRRSSPAASETTVELLAAHGPEAFALMRRHTYRMPFLDGMGLQRVQFGPLLRLARDVPVVRVLRPEIGTAPDVVLDAVLASPAILRAVR
jgi:hypothetical protein